MATIINRVTVGLTKENNRMLQELCEKYGEHGGQVFIRALNQFYKKIEENSD